MLSLVTSWQFWALYVVVGWLTLGLGVFLRWPEVHKTSGVLICLLAWFIPLLAFLGSAMLTGLHRGALWFFDPDHGPLAAAVHFAQRVWTKSAPPPPPAQPGSTT